LWARASRNSFQSFTIKLFTSNTEKQKTETLYLYETHRNVEFSMASAEVMNPASLPAGKVEEYQAPISVIPAPDASGEPSRGGVPSSFYDNVAPEVYLGPRGVQRTLINKQGLKLNAYFWPAENSKCVLLFVHGHGAHMQFELLKGQGPGLPQQYGDSWAERFNIAGVSVCGIDNQGCGLSEGLRNLRFYVESFDDYVDDVLQLAGLLCSKGAATDLSLPAGFSSLPTFISGISLGGCIAFNATNRRPDLFCGAAFLAPMLSLERVSRRGLNPYMRPVAALLNYVVPTAAVVATDRNTMHPDIQLMWDEDPLTLAGKTRVRNANEYLRATEAAMAQLDQVNFPFIVFHSENDTLCDSDGSKQLYKRAKVRYFLDSQRIKSDGLGGWGGTLG